MVTDRSYPICGRFDRYEIDLNRGELRRDGAGVAIQEQPFQILRMLLQAEGEVVTREQLRAALWPKDTFVDFEHGINTAVKKLRQALEDSAERPRFVETLPRVGYRFMAPVEWTNSRHGISLLTNVVAIAPPETPPIAQAGPPKRRWGLKVSLSGGSPGSDRLRISGSRSRHRPFPGASAQLQPAAVDGQSTRRAADQWGDLAGWQVSGLFGSNRAVSAKC